jgi:choline dehydrogenase-like flavoprotein
MARIIIVGSGAAGVHFALSALRKGHDVMMLDVEHQTPPSIRPMDDLQELKANLPDPVEYFLGENYEAVIQPDANAEYYGFPPNKRSISSRPPGFELHATGFEPLVSFAQGGLAEAWTGGVYPYNDAELVDFPLSYQDLEPYYNEVARRIGVTGVKDDLAQFLPFHQGILEPLELDPHSKLLLAAYERQRTVLNAKLGFYLGRSRIATLSREQAARQGCQYLGRCLWGCPVEAIYTPSITLRQCKSYPNFTYQPQMYVSHFKPDTNHQITHIVAQSLKTQKVHEFPLNELVLAAGTLSSSKIFLDSIYRSTGEVIKLRGLMDNRQILMPFLSPSMIGRPYNPKTYQYHQIGIGVKCENPAAYVHGQITTLKTGVIHPIIQQLPFDLKTSTLIFKHLHASLGVVNINYSDSRSKENFVTIAPNGNTSKTKLIINYNAMRDEKEAISKSVKKIKRALRRLGCLVVPRMTHLRPKGASVHYAGTLPMSMKNEPYTTSAYCRSHDFANLCIVDGCTFPFLPAKNITFTLMANALRVADHEF